MAQELEAEILEKKMVDSTEVIFIEPEGPEFPGGEQAMFRFMSANTKYPNKARRKGIQGIVYLQFLVKVDGTLSDIHVVKSVHELLDEEAVRVATLMPPWIPGKQDGIPVPVYYRLPFKFTLR